MWHFPPLTAQFSVINFHIAHETVTFASIPSGRALARCFLLSRLLLHSFTVLTVLTHLLPVQQLSSCSLCDLACCVVFILPVCLINSLSIPLK